MTAAVGCFAFCATGGAALPLAGALAALALVGLPVLMVAGTSFLKISVVLAILRAALGVPGVPPTAVVTALSSVLTMFVMAPVASDMLAGVRAQPALCEAAGGMDIERAILIYEAVRPTMIDFLSLNASEGEIAFFRELADAPAHETGLRILLPAFAVGELAEAFLIGFLLFLPFWVVDLIVAMVLAALGMPMLSPSAVSLPLKLMLFVAVDGWQLVLTGLLVNYGA